jgi:hypothetical protein
MTMVVNKISLIIISHTILSYPRLLRLYRMRHTSVFLGTTLHSGFLLRDAL